MSKVFIFLSLKIVIIQRYPVGHLQLAVIQGHYQSSLSRHHSWISFPSSQGKLCTLQKSYCWTSAALWFSGTSEFSLSSVAAQKICTVTCCQSSPNPQQQQLFQTLCLHSFPWKDGWLVQSSCYAHAALHNSQIIYTMLTVFIIFVALTIRSDINKLQVFSSDFSPPPPPKDMKLEMEQTDIL